ncbi:hypothetical protein CEXT_363311 [Caerostris extrusa]|uniref:Uncharacterized protein n=1 Tax=Caerostris extrusa TaxID=172846 RepID=A0AAV4PGF0_CAEEX|nr:hypothetical protein CEXT_363311 [Caerostris extrusa]
MHLAFSVEFRDSLKEKKRNPMPLFTKWENPCSIAESDVLLGNHPRPTSEPSPTVHHLKGEVLIRRIKNYGNGCTSYGVLLG